jgi:outer membrane protein OmpA-like peptidoglycan-associated protein
MGMKRIIFLIFMIGIVGVGKSQTFTLVDSSVQKYDMLRVYHIQFYTGKADIFPDSYSFLDSLAEYLIQHQEIKEIEIICNMDTRWSEEFSVHLSAKRALALVYYLVEKGINPGRLIAMGREDLKPLIAEQEINTMKTEQEKNEAHYKNRRVEFVIMEVE